MHIQEFVGHAPKSPRLPGAEPTLKSRPVSREATAERKPAMNTPRHEVSRPRHYGAGF